ncbi:MAG: hypothetical protein LC641_07680 [Spirochaeta sp.]|nr:hypothetical protein [Spirochaeta sp.]
MKTMLRWLILICAILAGGLVLLLNTACSQLAEALEHEEYVTVQAPPVPKAWVAVTDPQAKYSLLVTGEDGQQERHTFDLGVRHVELRVPKERITAVSYVLSPLPGLRLKAAGGVYPLHREPNGTLSVSYDNGFIAGLVHDLLSRNPGAVRNVNIARLELEVLQRSQGNPWQLDREAILRRLSGGAMRADSIRPLSGMTVELGLVEGGWLSLNPLELSLEPPFEVMLLPGEPQRWYHPEQRRLLSAGLDTFGNVEFVVRELEREYSRELSHE